MPRFCFLCSTTRHGINVPSSSVLDKRSITLKDPKNPQKWLFWGLIHPTPAKIMQVNLHPKPLEGQMISTDPTGLAVMEVDPFSFVLSFGWCLYCLRGKRSNVVNLKNTSWVWSNDSPPAWQMLRECGQALSGKKTCGFNKSFYQHTSIWLFDHGALRLRKNNSPIDKTSWFLDGFTRLWLE